MNYFLLCSASRINFKSIQFAQFQSNLDTPQKKIFMLYLNKYGDYSSSSSLSSINLIVKLRQGSGKDWQGMAVKAKGLKA